MCDCLYSAAWFLQKLLPRTKRRKLKHRLLLQHNGSYLCNESGFFFFFPFINLLNRLEDKEELEEPKSAEKYGSSCNTQPLKLGAKEIILPNVIGMFDIFLTKILRGKLERKATS